MFIAVVTTALAVLGQAQTTRLVSYDEAVRCAGLTQAASELEGGESRYGRTLYDAALDGGAQALGQAIGALEVGKRADWLVLDGNDPYLATATEDGILNRWLFAGGDRQVRDVLVNGKWVVRDGHHAGEEDSNRAFTQVLKDLLD